MMSYEPTPVQKAFHQACLQYPIVLFMGATGAGKTTALICQVIDDCLMVKNNRGMLARMTYEDLRDTVLEDLLIELETARIPYTHYKRYRFIHFPSTNSVLYLSGLGDTVKTLRRTKGRNLGFIAIDQLEDIPREVFTFQLTRLRLPHVPPERRHLFATANPVPEDHWIYEMFVGDPERGIEPLEGAKVIYTTLDDNPHLPPEFRKLLLQTLTTEEIDRYVKGEWGFVPVGQRAFPMFDKRVHVGQIEFDPRYALIIGMDFGYRHPAAVWLQVVGEPDDPVGRRVHVLDEFLGTDLLLDDFIEIVRDRTQAYFPKAEIVFYCGDPYAATARSDRGEAIDVHLRQRYQIALRMRRMPLENSIQNIAGLLRLNKLILSPKCRILIKAFEGGYRRDEQGEIVKDGYFDHLVDALRYALDVFAPFGVLHPIVPSLNRAFRLKRLLGAFRPL